MELCDYIAERIRRCLPLNDPQALFGAIGPVRWDVTKSGAIKSNKKTIEISDIEGRKYQVTIDKI